MSAFAQLTGRLGQDPTLNFTHAGTPVVNLSVANNRRVKTGDERSFVADWYKVTLFGRDAEIIAAHARKGSALAFNGRLQIESYEDREGNPRSSVVLVASSFEFMRSAKREDGTADKANTPSSSTRQNGATDSEVEDDDIPF